MVGNQLKFATIQVTFIIKLAYMTYELIHNLHKYTISVQNKQ